MAFTKWNDIKHKSSPAKREKIKQEVLAELRSENLGVGLIRTERHQTQMDVAEQMKVPQSAVSRLESQQDCRVSTLRRYVAALGGRLEMRVVFPDETLELDLLLRKRSERNS